jgi:hypothetical protein
MASAHALLKNLRLIHLYVGVFITPALLFFAFTGAIQTFSLHETTRGSSYKPPAILAELAQLHKHQTLVVDPSHKSSSGGSDKSQPNEPRSHHDDSPAASQPAQPPAAPAAKPASTPPGKAKSLLPMKIFFLLVAIGLLTSTLSGLYMSYKYIRNRRLITALLLAGIIVPLLLTIF